MLGKHLAWLKDLPLADMIRFGWVPKLADKALQVRECLKFFAVSDVAAWRETYSKPVAAYRAVPKLKHIGPSVAAWLREGERRAGEIRCEDFDKVAFGAALTKVRVLTREPNPANFLPALQALCASGGVAVVVAPAPKGCPVSGATKWLATNKALIMLSVRGRSDDKLWFTFFHEAGHLLKHGKSLTFIDILGEAGLDGKEEAEADAFARDYLLPAGPYSAFVDVGRFDTAAVTAFASTQNVSTGIVVGRLQYERRLPYTHLNTLKVRYTWEHESN